MVIFYIGGEALMKRIQDPLGWPELKSVWEEEARKKNRIGRRNLALTPCGQAEEAFKAFSKAIKISPKYDVACLRKIAPQKQLEAWPDQSSMGKFGHSTIFRQPKAL